MMKIKRGDIVIISFDPSIGREIKKIRPALVIQNDIACKYSDLITVLPFTSTSYSNKIYEYFVGKNKFNGLEKDSVLLINQIKTFDKSRIVKVLGEVSEEILDEVYQKIDIHFGRI